MSRVYVRIVLKDNKWLVIGRKTTIECATFDEAWVTSIPYFLGRKF